MRILGQYPSRPDLDRLIAESIRSWQCMSPAEQERLLAEQRASYAKGYVTPAPKPRYVMMRKERAEAMQSLADNAAIEGLAGFADAAHKLRYLQILASRVVNR